MSKETNSNVFINYRELLKFYAGKKVFITGHTGFKGSWLTHILVSAGAEVTGYSLGPPTTPSLFSLLQLSSRMNSIIGDVRDLDALKAAVAEAKPDILLHLAAQPIVRDSYRTPVDTYSTNVMGTVNVCEAVRLSCISETSGGLQTTDWEGVKSFLNVTTDKVYRNNEWEWGYRETDFLDGYDPYSNSKSCSEIVTHGYIRSFFNSEGIRCSTARAGNVIGGGDFANDRIVPDCIRALVGASENINGEHEAEILVRTPYSTRPYEHVLEPLFAYLLIVAEQYKDEKFSSYYNVGPDDIDCVTTGELVSMFCEKWNSSLNSTEGREEQTRTALYSDNSENSQTSVGDTSLSTITWKNVSNHKDDSLHEANFLKLDCSKLKATFGWKPTWHISDALDNIVAFTHVLLESSGDSAEERSEKLKAEMDREIENFIS